MSGMEEVNIKYKIIHDYFHNKILRLKMNDFTKEEVIEIIGREFEEYNIKFIPLQKMVYKLFKE